MDKCFRVLALADLEPWAEPLGRWNVLNFAWHAISVITLGNCTPNSFIWQHSSVPLALYCPIFFIIIQINGKVMSFEVGKTCLWIFIFYFLWNMLSNIIEELAIPTSRYCFEGGLASRTPQNQAFEVLGIMFCTEKLSLYLVCDILIRSQKDRSFVNSLSHPERFPQWVLHGPNCHQNWIFLWNCCVAMVFLSGDCSNSHTLSIIFTLHLLEWMYKQFRKLNILQSSIHHLLFARGCSMQKGEVVCNRVFQGLKCCEWSKLRCFCWLQCYWFYCSA